MPLYLSFYWAKHFISLSFTVKKTESELQFKILILMIDDPLFYILCYKWIKCRYKKSKLTTRKWWDKKKDTRSLHAHDGVGIHAFE